MTAPLSRDTGDAEPYGALRRDTALVAVGQLAAVLSAFLVTLVGARVLPTEEFGALAWALSWLAFLAVLAQFGLTQVATIAFAREAPATHRALLGRLLAAQAVGVVIVSVLAYALRPFAGGGGEPPEAYRPLVAVIALWLPVAAVGPVLVNVLRARARFGWALVFGEHVRRLILIAVLLAGAAGLTAASTARTALAWTAALESAAYLVGVLVVVRMTAPRGGGRHTAGRVRADRARERVPAGVDRTGSVRGLLRWGSGFTLATLAAVTVPQAGIWLLALFEPVEEVAVFSVAVRIAVLFVVPTAIGMRTLAPRIAAASAAGRLQTLQTPIRAFATWSTVVTALAVLVLAATGQVLLPAVFGAEYGAALTPALVMCAGVLVNAWTGPCSVLLSHADRQRTVAVSALVSALMFFVLASWWAALWGATGVAAAAAVAMSVRNLHLAAAAHRALGITTIALPGRRGKSWVARSS